MGKFYKEILISFLPLPTCFHRTSKDAEQQPYCLLIIQRQLLLKDCKASCQTFNSISQWASLQKGSVPFHTGLFRKKRFQCPVRLHCKVILKMNNWAPRAEGQQDGQEPSPKHSEHGRGQMDPSWKSSHHQWNQLLDLTEMVRIWAKWGGIPSLPLWLRQLTRSLRDKEVLSSKGS